MEWQKGKANKFLTPLTRVILDKSQKILQADEIKYFFLVCQKTYKTEQKEIIAMSLPVGTMPKINLTDKKIRKRKEDSTTLKRCKVIYLKD